MNFLVNISSILLYAMIGSLYFNRIFSCEYASQQEEIDFQTFTWPNEDRDDLEFSDHKLIHIDSAHTSTHSLDAFNSGSDLLQSSRRQYWTMKSYKLFRLASSSKSSPVPFLKDKSTSPVSNSSYMMSFLICNFMSHDSMAQKSGVFPSRVCMLRIS